MVTMTKCFLTTTNAATTDRPDTTTKDTIRMPTLTATYAVAEHVQGRTP